MATKYTFNITDLSYDSLLEQARVLASIYFPTWEFDNPNDLGRLALDIYLHGVDRALWLANTWAGEWNLLTAKERRHVEARAMALGYPLKARVASIGTIDVTFTASGSTRNIAQYGIRFSILGDDGELVYFENSEAFSIPSMITEMSFDLVEGKSITQSALGTGKAFQEVTIEKTKVIAHCVQMTVNSAAWTEVSSFGSSGATSKHFVLEYMGDNDSRIVFGDGVYGAIPPLNGAIAINARIGGGTRGNIPNANKITTVEMTPYTFDVRASSAADGGQDVEPLDQIRLLAPRYRRAYDRIVGTKDVETATILMEGVVRCLVTLVTRAITVRVVPSSGGVPSDALINNVYAGLIDRILIGYTLNVIPPSYKTAIITITATKKAGFLDAEVEASLQTDLLAMLSSISRDADGNFLNEFGGDLTLARISSVVTENGSLMPGFVINLPAADVVVADTEMLNPAGSTITISLV